MFESLAPILTQTNKKRTIWKLKKKSGDMAGQTTDWRTTNIYLVKYTDVCLNMYRYSPFSHTCTLCNCVRVDWLYCVHTCSLTTTTSGAGHSGLICISFAYHMYGTNVGTLRVLVVQSGSDVRDVWITSGDHGDQWQTMMVGTSVQNTQEVST